MLLALALLLAGVADGIGLSSLLPALQLTIAGTADDTAQSDFVQGVHDDARARRDFADARPVAVDHPRRDGRQERADLRGGTAYRLHRRRRRDRAAHEPAQRRDCVAVVVFHSPVDGHTRQLDGDRSVARRAGLRLRGARARGRNRSLGLYGGRGRRVVASDTDVHRRRRAGASTSHIFVRIARRAGDRQTHWYRSLLGR